MNLRMTPRLEREYDKSVADDLKSEMQRSRALEECTTERGMLHDTFVGGGPSEAAPPKSARVGARAKSKPAPAPETPTASGSTDRPTSSFSAPKEPPPKGRKGKSKEGKKGKKRKKGTWVARTEGTRSSTGADDDTMNTFAREAGQVRREMEGERTARKVVMVGARDVYFLPLKT